MSAKPVIILRLKKTYVKGGDGLYKNYDKVGSW